MWTKELTGHHLSIGYFSLLFTILDADNVSEIYLYRIDVEGFYRSSYDRIEKCCRREGRSDYMNSVVSFWNRRTSSGNRSEGKKEEKKKGETAEGCRKRVDGGGKKKRKKKEREQREGGWWMYVTGDRMRQLLNGWLTDEEHDRLIRFEGGENSFQVFSSCKPWCLFSGPRPAWFRCTYLLPVSTSRSRSSNSIPLSPPVDVCRLSHLWKHALGNTYEHIVWTSSK